MKNTNKKPHDHSSSKVTLITLCVFVLALFSVNNLFTQNTCASPTSVTVNGGGTGCSLVLSAVMGTPDPLNPMGSPAPCVITNQFERWIVFTAIAPTATIVVNQSGVLSATRQLAVTVYSGTCGALTQIGCANSNTSTAALQTESLTLAGLDYTTPATYYVRVINEGNTSSLNTQVCITSNPIPNDEPAGAIPLAVSPSSVCTAAQFNNFFATNTNCSPSIPNPSCSSYIPGTSQDIWFTVAVTAPGNLNINNSGQPYGLALYSGTNSPGCGTMTEVTCSETGAVGPSPLTFAGISLTGLATGTYYLRAWKKTPVTSTFSLCATSVPITPPANDNPCGAQLATATTASICATAFTTTILGATSSATLNAPTIGCSGLATGAANDDVWAAFTATSTTHQITIQTFTPNTSPANDFYFAMYAASGPTTCPTVSGSEILCSPSNTATASGLTIGNRYLIRFFNETAIAGYTTGITYCITTPTVANNDECTGPVQVTANAGSACTSSVSGTVFGATASFQNNGCAIGDDDDDVWYFFTATSTSHSITITTTSAVNFYHSVYSGICGNIGPAIICADPNASILYGLTVGNNYFVRVYSSPTGGAVTAITGTFVICVNTPTSSLSCFTPAGNDFCPNPTSLSQSAYTFTGTVGSPTSTGIYTSDVPGNLGTVFGGSIEGNAWYSFIAVTTTHTFNIVPTGGCTVQARVLNVALSGGCCTSFTSMSNFYSSSTSGTITATGLTVGSTYFLMVDGLSTADCAYSIPTWVLTSTLPIEYLSFIGYIEGKTNVLKWVTASENNKTKFTLERSKDGTNFESVVTINSKGSIDKGGTYLAYDENPFDDITYYRLKHTDNTSNEKYSNTISINLKNKYNKVFNIHPNPTKNDVLFDYYSKNIGNISIELLSSAGATVVKTEQKLEEGKNNISLPMNHLDNGLYILKVYSEKSGNSSYHKIIKN